MTLTNTHQLHGAVHCELWVLLVRYYRYYNVFLKFPNVFTLTSANHSVYPLKRPLFINLKKCFLLEIVTMDKRFKQIGMLSDMEKQISVLWWMVTGLRGCQMWLEWKWRRVISLMLSEDSNFFKGVKWISDCCFWTAGDGIVTYWWELWFLFKNWESPICIRKAAVLHQVQLK